MRRKELHNKWDSRMPKIMGMLDEAPPKTYRQIAASFPNETKGSVAGAIKRYRDERAGNKGGPTKAERDKALKEGVA